MTCDLSYYVFNLKYNIALLYDHSDMLTLTPSLNGHMENECLSQNANLSGPNVSNMSTVCFSNALQKSDFEVVTKQAEMLSG